LVLQDWPFGSWAVVMTWYFNILNYQQLSVELPREFPAIWQCCPLLYNSTIIVDGLANPFKDLLLAAKKSVYFISYWKLNRPYGDFLQVSLKAGLYLKHPQVD
jgi:hypothetical protein